MSETVEEIANIIESEQIVTDIYHTHGSVCGLLCCGRSIDAAAWSQSLLDELNSDDGQDAERVLRQFFDATARELSDSQCQFQLLLADDHDGLGFRTGVLSRWVVGFLDGLIDQRINESAKFPDEIKEAIEDLSRIAEVDSDLNSPMEADETAYFELVEYVRVAAMLIFETCRSTEAVS